LQSVIGIFGCGEHRVQPPVFPAREQQKGECGVSSISSNTFSSGATWTRQQRGKTCDAIMGTIEEDQEAMRERAPQEG
jgi:hypothetical protein